LIRHFTKWDDQPASAEAARESLMRAWWLTRMAPMGPVYVNLDAGMQEAPLGDTLPPVAVARFIGTPTPPAPSATAIAQAAALLRDAKRAVILYGRGSRQQDHWANRVRLAESLGARVITDLKLAAVFPTDHALHAGAPSTFPGPDAIEVLAGADVVLSLEWVDLAGTLRAAQATPQNVIVVSCDYQVHNGWSMDYQALPPADLFLPCDADSVVTELLPLLPSRAVRYEEPVTTAIASSPGIITVPRMAAALRRAVGSRPTSLLHVSLSWNAAVWPFREPLDYIGGDGGAGIGGGPGIAVGAALALRGAGRLPVAVCGDGDFLMGVTALWTAVHYNIPLLIVVANNRSFFNDEQHQERVARARNRPVENRWIGQRIAGPEIDLARMAAAEGAAGFGPVADPNALESVFAEAIIAVEAGAVAVVDVRTSSSSAD